MQFSQSLIRKAETAIQPGITSGFNPGDTHQKHVTAGITRAAAGAVAFGLAWATLQNRLHQQIGCGVTTAAGECDSEAEAGSEQQTHLPTGGIQIT